MTPKTRVVVIGGVAGGASAATRARRLAADAEIMLVERGPHVSYANGGLPYHIGGAIADREQLLVASPELLSSRYALSVRTRTEAVAINRDRKTVTLRNLERGTEEELPYDKLILSPGAEPIRPPIPGVEDPRVHTLRSLSDMDAILKQLNGDHGGRALVIGGGYIGLEMAEALRERDLAVTLVELAPQVMGPLDPEMAAPLHDELRRHGVDLRLETSVTRFSPAADGLTAHLSDGETVTVGLVILAIGVRPDVKLAREAGLQIGARGGIVVDEKMRTSDPHIFAVGDAVEVTDLVSGEPALVPLAGPANRQGRIAADNALGRRSVYHHTQGTGICKVFDLAAGMTGMSEKALKRAGKPYDKVYVHPASHASYYPGAAPLSLKLLFDPQNGRVLGAQVVGSDGVDKRVDVLAVAIRAGLTVFDLEALELSYAPPYGSAKDPVNYAGFVAANVLRGDVTHCHVADVLAPREDQVLLDVREPEELAVGTIPGAIHLPLSRLRQQLAELPRDKELLTFCQVGMRGYLACRILSQHGFRCRNLTGGYKTYAASLPKPAARPVAPPPVLSDDSGSNGNGNGSARRLRSVVPVKEVDATGLQCPGPVLRLAAEVQGLREGEALAITTTDPGFASDVGPWCHSTGNTLVEVAGAKGRYRAVVAKGSGAAAPVNGADSKKKTLVVFSGDFDRAMAAVIIANGAAAMGSQVTLFFTFWGLNILRRPESVKTEKNLVERLFGWMMPRGAERLGLSRMHLGGMGLAMIKRIMRQKSVPSLADLIATARRSGVKLVACSMSMGLMGIKREELVEGVTEGGVAMYLNAAEAGTVNLFV